MASSFMGLYVQRDGLNYAQKALDITGSNLLNSKVEGYSRQRLDLKSAYVNNHCVGYINQVYLAGAGVEAEGVTQIRSEIYDDKYRTHNAVVGEYTVEKDTLSQIEDALDDIENETTGFAHTLQVFRDSWQAFSSSGTDQTDLANITKNCAQSVIDVLRNFNNRIENVREDAFDDIEKSVQKVNGILRQCAALNSDIKSGYVLYGDFYQTGFYDGEGNDYQADNDYGPLEAKDMMNNLIDDLSEYGDVKVKIETDGTYTITMAGKEVVQQDKYAVLTYDVAYRRNESCTSQEYLLDANGDPTTTKNPDYAPSEPKYIYKDEQKVRMGELNFELSELKTDKKWRNSYIQLEDTNVTKGFDQDMLQDLRISVMSGDFNKARNIEQLMLKKADIDGVDYKKQGYIPVFNENRSIKDFDSILSHGKLRGQLDMYNGGGKYAVGVDPTAPNDEIGILYYKKTIDALAKAVHDEFNAVYKDNGIDNFGIFDYGNAVRSDENGIPLLEYSFTDENGITTTFNFPEGMDPASLTGTAVGDKDVYTYTVTDNDGHNVKKSFALPKGHDISKYVPTDITAEGLILSEKFSSTPILAVHPEGGNVTDANYQQIANTWVNRISSVFDRKHFIGNESDGYTFEEFVKFYGNSVGNQINSITQQNKSESILLAGASTLRQTVMGVSTDEEGIHMLVYQKWYNAMARMTTALDDLLDKLINNTGRVGL